MNLSLTESLVLAHNRPALNGDLADAPGRLDDASLKKRPGSLFPTSRAVILATSYSRTTYRRTTIGAAAFHFRVRNGNGWGHCAMITRSEERLRFSALVRDSRSLHRQTAHCGYNADSRFSFHDRFQRTPVRWHL